MVRLHWITLQQTHLLKVPDPAVCHLRRLARGASGKVIGVNHGALQPSARCVQHKPRTIGATSYDEDVELVLGVFEVLEVLMPRLELEIILDLVL